MTDDSKLTILAALPSDASDVAVALEAAKTTWQNGDPQEALRWLKRAAEAAGEAGDDARAVDLAKAAASLKDSLETAAQPTAATPPPPPPPPPATWSRPPEALPQPPRAARSRPPPPPSARPKATPPPPPSARHSSAPAPMPPPASTGTSGTMAAISSAPPPSASIPAAPLATAPAGPPPASSPAPVASQPPSAPPSVAPVAERRPSVVPARAPLAKTTSVAPPRPIASTLPPLSNGRVRVSVKSSVRDPNLFLVRLLQDGQSAPPGTQEAFLTGGDAASLAAGSTQAT